MASPQIDWTLPGADGQPILGTTHMPPAVGTPAGMLLICHGFKGYKDYGFFPWLAEQAAARGMYALRFNFSHCGMANNLATFDRGSNFDRLDLFERDTWGKQIEDLTNVSNAVAAARIPGVDDANLPQVFFGHSRGGVTALLTASRLGAAEGKGVRPAGVIAAATPAQACSLDETQKQQLRSEGYLESPSSRTGQMLRVGRRWLREIEHDPQGFDPKIAAGRLPCPLLIVHGSGDETVPVRDAHELRSAAGESVEFLVVPDAGHTFNAPNPMPWQNVPMETAQMAEAACRFALVCCRG